MRAASLKKSLTQTTQLLPPFLERLVQESQAIPPQAELAARINSAHQQCVAFPTTALLHARNAGEWLLQAQEQLTPEGWLSWLKECCTVSERTAQTYMQIARGWPKLVPSPAILPASETSALALRDCERAELSSNVEEPIQIAATLEPAPPISPKETLLPATDTLTFFIPGGVVPKARPRVTANGTFLPPRYRAWRNHAEVEIFKQLGEKSSLPVLPLQRAAVKVRLIGKHRMNADGDNIVGSCLDSLVAAGVIKNDNLSYIPEIYFKLIPQGTQGVQITLLPLPSPEGSK